MIDKGITTVDLKEREKAYQELEQYIVNEHVPWIFMYLQDLIYGVSSNLDWKPRPDEIIDLRQAKLK